MGAEIGPKKKTNIALMIMKGCAEMNDELKKDMCDLAKMVYEVSKKHGGIYLDISICENSTHASVTTKLKRDYESILYWGKKYTLNSIDTINCVMDMEMEEEK